MTIQQLNGKNVCLVGYGLEGEAMLKALKIYAPDATVTVADQDPTLQINGTPTQLGVDYLKDLDRFDVLIRSGGIPNAPELDAEAAKNTNMASIFFDTVIDTGVRIIGITGSKGKSTTTTLIYNQLHAFNPDHTFLMGNLYLPMINFLGQAKPGNTFVIELSSYMLEYMRRSPHIAVVTSFFPEHLDRHGSVQNYWEAKKHIAQHQTANDSVFYSADYPKCKELADASPGQKIAFSAADCPVDLAETKFIGNHNRSNIAAAFKVATLVGVPRDVAISAIKQTEPLPHRLQDIGMHAGLNWVNDSIATAPEATAAALNALGEKVETIFLGGFDRGYDFKEFGDLLAHLPTLKNIVLFPETGARIKASIVDTAHKNYLETSDMDQAVQWAAQQTAPGKTVLLSCASPSFSLYKDFNARGEAFMNAVKNLDIKQ